MSSYHHLGHLLMFPESLLFFPHYSTKVCSMLGGYLDDHVLSELTFHLLTFTYLLDANHYLTLAHNLAQKKNREHGEKKQRKYSRDH